MNKDELFDILFNLVIFIFTGLIIVFTVTTLDKINLDILNQYERIAFLITMILSVLGWVETTRWNYGKKFREWCKK